MLIIDFVLSLKEEKQPLIMINKSFIKMKPDFSPWLDFYYTFVMVTKHLKLCYIY